MFTLFKKELRQHGILAVAMVCMCLFFQIGYVEWWRFNQMPIDGESFFGLTLFVVVLYAGVAAALAYSTEHADNTFIFLRKLPISQSTLAVGKIGWVLCGTVCVLVGNLLLALLWGANFLEDIWLAYGVGIIEAFVWGLFWSTRCRRQVDALLFGYTCASGSAFIIPFIYYSFVTPSTDVLGMYGSMALPRLLAAGIIGIFAIWGAFRWFDYEVKGSFFARLIPQDFHLFRYPKYVQPPFLALIHHHVRHASWLYPLGILCMIGWTIGCIVYCCMPTANNFRQDITGGWWWVTGVCAVGAGMFIFWATIFGHDQKNDSYRVLSRLGIHEGKVWWSRMLPGFLMYVPVVLGVGILVILGDFCHDWVSDGPDRDDLLYALGILLSILFSPMAVGAFISVSFRSQLVSIALSLGGVFLVLAWMMLGVMLFGVFPLWTTLPICLALLIASRIRATYWLRETFTWRSRLIPLIPVFAAVLAILVALPLVRIYSLPSVSWEQIDAYFDQAQSERIQDPVKRKALIQYIAEHRAAPAEYDSLLAKLKGSWYEMEDVGDCTYDELILVYHVLAWDWLTQPIEETNNGKTTYIYLTRYTPWEAVRIDRALRLQIVATLVKSSGLQDKDAEAIREFCAKREYNYGGRAYFDHYAWMASGWSIADAIERRLISRRLETASYALNKWYMEHENTLPESLDELVPDGYLDEIPVHPFMDKKVEYVRNAPAPVVPGVDYHKKDKYLVHHRVLGPPVPDDGVRDRRTREAEDKRRADFQRSGGTYLRLGTMIRVLIEPDI